MSCVCEQKKSAGGSGARRRTPAAGGATHGPRCACSPLLEHDGSRPPRSEKSIPVSICYTKAGPQQFGVQIAMRICLDELLHCQRTCGRYSSALHTVPLAGMILKETEAPMDGAALAHQKRQQEHQGKESDGSKCSGHVSPPFSLRQNPTFEKGLNVIAGAAFETSRSETLPCPA